MNELEKYAGDVLCKCGFTQPDSLLRASDVEKLTGVSIRTLYRMVNDGDFPKPFKISKKSNHNFWYRSDITNWIGSLNPRRKEHGTTTRIEN